ncbi:hypothetical protein K505DRAFT_257607 [Melanomma pulvis-pyrius CBS 109.77]|uniref:Uncharacterized protein n=1 Tax=Melanomma pulvis-pyrius CBS 109.77 TaxID=1314802 RepID=A0A6A6WTS4_9PLEO|nr:hypothetical protein K505DRAFT_257607 [Melanomma pulvis-pyrius CBS 109.77]
MNSTATTPKAAATLATKDAAATGPNRQRRRPRKLNKEPAAQSSASIATPATTTPVAVSTSTGEIPPPASTLELEALKSRVRGLEAKVEQLYNSSTEARSARSPRRRGKARKGSSTTQVPTIPSTAADTGTVVEEEGEEEADEELVRLEGELEIARQDLEAYQPRSRTRPRPRTRRTMSADEDEDVEEIPRDGIGGTVVEEMARKGDRQVTLSGNYRIPLPASVSMTDVKSIQSGVSAAQNVAKSFLEQRRAQAKLGTVDSSSKAQMPKKGKQGAGASTAVSTETTGEGGKSWGEWFGGYSVAISRAVKNIEAEAALETQKTGAVGRKRPTQAGRTASTKSTVAKPSKGNAGAVPKTGQGQRPPLKPSAGNMSSEQVHGLMK